LPEIDTIFMDLAPVHYLHRLYLDNRNFLSVTVEYTYISCYRLYVKLTTDQKLNKKYR